METFPWEIRVVPEESQLLQTIAIEPADSFLTLMKCLNFVFRYVESLTCTRLYHTGPRLFVVVVSPERLDTEPTTDARIGVEGYNISPYIKSHLHKPATQILNLIRQGTRNGTPRELSPITNVLQTADKNLYRNAINGDEIDVFIAQSRAVSQFAMG